MICSSSLIDDNLFLADQAGIQIASVKKQGQPLPHADRAGNVVEHTGITRCSIETRDRRTANESVRSMISKSRRVP